MITGPEFKELRKSQGFASGEALGEAMGINRSKIAAFESGRLRLSIDFLLAACRVLAVPPTRLVPELGEFDPDYVQAKKDIEQHVLERVRDAVVNP